MNNPGRELSLLVVEDNVFQRKVLMHQLRALGYPMPLAAGDGEAALALCNQHPVDILLCDLRMPGMDGMALLRRLSLNGFRGGIILVSALDEDVVEAVHRMSDAYGLRVLGRLDKPSSPARLAELLARWAPDTRPPLAGSGPHIGVADLTKALAQGEIMPWYQPKVSFATGEWLGVEALSRWLHPTLGMIPPGRFIPLAEEQGLITLLTERLIEQCLQDKAHWQTSGLAIKLSLNISSSSLVEGKLCDRLLEQCRQKGINPNLITLEVTESAFVKDLGHSLEMLSRLRMHGFGLSIDDFGTGYSSMQQLSLLPFTELKLDRSFVDRCHEDPVRLAIIESTLTLARKIGLRTVAEGVEDKATWDELARLGCDECQGYYAGRPMPQDQLLPWHEQWQARAPAR
ncbi:EAL domain-containing response regulator [Aeromonas lusitana]|uniref:Diguanylate phosphodiesterase n=1 Tax=Aeromonas lusitana TaxID=931529 RepID=A0A2M8HCF9_9GAMM|nr:EAL domain-containing response regulator [Aeromonas lusitana]PJC94171.1 diguanylate phosphodiesterase [Aeromonas lusitana]